MKSLISIIIPVHNREQCIAETLNSVIAQTHSNWECLIIDDGSTDNTKEIVRSYSDQDCRFKFFLRPPGRKKGASSCRNIGLEKAKGEFIQFLDSDDLMAKNKLEEQSKVCRGDFTLITCKWGGLEDDTDLKSRFKYKYHSYRNFRKAVNLLKSFGKRDEFFPSHVYLTPRKLVNEAGKWNEELTNNDDAEFFTRIILSAKSIRFTPKTEVYYRYSGSDKLSSLNSEEKVRSAVESWKLIETYIQQDQQNSALIYVENAKRFLKKNIEEKFPKILEEERIFFQRKSSLFSLQILSKINFLLKRIKLNPSK